MAALLHRDTLSDDLDQKLSHDTPTIRASVTPEVQAKAKGPDEEVARVCKECMESAPADADACPNCGGELVSFRKMPDAYLGTTVAGKYRIEEKIGQGGMGVVYRAVNDELGQRVAVKFLSKKLADDENLVLRFLNEAKSYCRVNHPNAVTLLEYGQHEDGTLYIITEFIDGMNVTETLKEKGPLDPETVLHVGIQIAEVLSAAHHQGVIHRDLKPDNIMLSPSPRGRLAVKVLDFGIAKIVDEEDGPNTETGSVFGTPEFMSPEQARGDEVDPRSDIYALGVILFYVISGRLPFRGKNKLVVLNKQLNEDPPRPSELRTDVAIPARLEAVIMKCLNKGRSQRYPSADDLLEALEELRLPGGLDTAKIGVAASDKATTEELRASTVRLGDRFDVDEPTGPRSLGVDLEHDHVEPQFESVELSREMSTDTSRTGPSPKQNHTLPIIGILGAVVAISIAALFIGGGDSQPEIDLNSVVLTGHTTAVLDNISAMIQDGSLDAASTSLATTRDWVGDDALPESARAQRDELERQVEALISQRDAFRSAMTQGDCGKAKQLADEAADASEGLGERLRARVAKCGEGGAEEKRQKPTTVAKPKPAPKVEPTTTAKPAPKPEPVAAKKPVEVKPAEPTPPVETKKEKTAEEKLPDGMALPPRTIGDGE